MKNVYSNPSTIVIDIETTTVICASPGPMLGISSESVNNIVGD